MRLCIIGGPKTGKTTLAAELAASRGPLAVGTAEGAFRVRSSDEAMHLGWSEASAEVALWLDNAGPWIVEGVAVPRALRKWLAAHAEGKPCDIVLVLTTAHIELSKGQAAMGKGVATVWAEVLPELRRRGVEVMDVEAVRAEVARSLEAAAVDGDGPIALEELVGAEGAARSREAAAAITAILDEAEVPAGAEGAR